MVAGATEVTVGGDEARGAPVRAVRLCATAVLRRGWAGMLAVALLVAIGGGAVLAAAAGARRTDTAATRLYRHGVVADAEIDPISQSVSASGVAASAIRRIPEVKDAAAATFYALGIRHGHGSWQPQLFAAADASGRWLYHFDRIGLVPSFRGRMPNPHRADEVVPTVEEARQLHLHLGSTLHVAVGKLVGADSQFGDWKPVTLHVVGIATTPLGLLQGVTTQTFFFATPAFAQRYQSRNLGATTYVVLHHSDQLLAFERHLNHLAHGAALEIKPASEELSTFARVATPYTDTLWLFALVAGIATVLVVAQAAVRMIRTDAASGPELRALGVATRGRASIAAVRATSAVVIGVALAIVLAVAASPLFPLGLVHRVEPDPGMRVDALALALGAAAIGLCLVAVIAFAARRSARPVPNDDPGSLGRTSRAAQALDRANAPVTVVAGTRFALSRGTGVDRASTASAIFGLVAAIAATSAALVFGVNLAQLTTPRHYGQAWDAEIVWNGTTVMSPTKAEHTLVRPALERAATLGTFDTVKIGGRSIESFGLQRRFGDAMPIAITGRLPTHRGEVALGVRTMRQLHTAVGSTITATSVSGTTQKLHVVGQTLLPSLNSNVPALGADDGAEFTRAGLDQLDPGQRHEIDFAIVDLAPHTTVTDLEHVFPSSDYVVTGASPPGYIASYGNVESTPLVLAGLLTLLGVGVLAHLLVTSVRQRQRELAVLKTLGCTRRQLPTMVVWQALLLTLIALVVGMTVGVLLGRAAWKHFALGLGLSPLTDVPYAQLTAIVVVGLALAAAIASMPARAATRIVPARLLRTE
jgi:FtsX-like permease family